MKLRSIASAIAVLATMGSAHAIAPADITAAAHVVHLTGASALRLSIGAHMASICNNDLDVFFSSVKFPGIADAGKKLGDDYRAYSCTLKATIGTWNAGEQIVVHKRDYGGSGKGVGDIITNTAQTHMKIDNTCSRSANPTPVTDFANHSYVCAGNETLVSDAGISDVEPAMMNQTINLKSGTTAATVAQLNNLTVAPFVQALFGIAVNKSLYVALQQAQGLDASIATPYLPSGASQADMDARKKAFYDNMPSIPSSFVRGAFIGGFTGSAGSARGWDLLIPASVDGKVNGKTVNVCRRQAGSGTQAASNVFFAQNPCGQGLSAAITPLGTQGTMGVKSGSVAVNEASSSGNVETCLGTTVEGFNDAVEGKAYGLAFLGRENNPFVNDTDTKGYRFVKLDGNAPLRAEAVTGKYPMVFESTIQWNTTNPNLTTDLVAFLQDIAKAAKPAALSLVDVDTQEGVMSPPASDSRSRAAIAAADLANGTNHLSFLSRVKRNAGNSCNPLVLFK